MSNHMGLNRKGVDPAGISSAHGTSPVMQTRRPDNVVTNMLQAPTVVRGHAKANATRDLLPYEVRFGKGKSRRYQHGRDAIAFAQRHRDSQVWFTGQALVHLDYADQTLPASDKAKPPKGTCGAFCKGQTSKVQRHYVSRLADAVRVY